MNGKCDKCGGELGKYHHVHLVQHHQKITLIFGDDAAYPKNAIIRFCQKCGHINVIEYTTTGDF